MRPRWRIGVQTGFSRYFAFNNIFSAMICARAVFRCFRRLERWADRITGAAGPYFVGFAVILISAGALCFCTFFIFCCGPQLNTSPQSRSSCHLCLIRCLPCLCVVLSPPISSCTTSGYAPLRQVSQTTTAEVTRWRNLEGFGRKSAAEGNILKSQKHTSSFAGSAEATNPR